MRGEEPVWNVCGHIVACEGAASGQVEYRVRTYADGRGSVEADGLVYPLSPTTTAAQYFDAIFSRLFGPREQRVEGSGD